MSFASQPAIGIFSNDEIALLDEIAETILPETTTPGAKAAKTGAFIALMITDCYLLSEQNEFRRGIHSVDELTKTTYTVSFMVATQEQRRAVLSVLDKEQVVATQSRSLDSEDPLHFFRIIKDLTLLGYFTSEIGCTKALRYVDSPGRFDPSIPYAPGDKAWAI